MGPGGHEADMQTVREEANPTKFGLEMGTNGYQNGQWPVCVVALGHVVSACTDTNKHEWTKCIAPLELP